MKTISCKPLFAALLVAGSTAFGAPAARSAESDPAPPDPPAVARLRESGLDVKPGGIIGREFRFWLITAPDGRQAFAATTPEGYLALGKIFSPDGTLALDTEGNPPLSLTAEGRRARGLARLTGQPLSVGADFAWRTPGKGVAAPAAPAAPAGPKGTIWDRLGHATAIEEGRAGAPLVYIFVDPYCPYCHKQWEALRRKVDAGALRVRWVPVAVLTASQANLGVVGGLLADPRPETLSAWMRARRVRPDTSEATQRALGLNMALFQALKVPQVPALIYKDPTGRVIRKAGVADL